MPASDSNSPALMYLVTRPPATPESVMIMQHSTRGQPSPPSPPPRAQFAGCCRAQSPPRRRIAPLPLCVCGFVACVCVCARARACVCVFGCMFRPYECAHTYGGATRTPTHAHAHAHTHTHTHTHTCTHMYAHTRTGCWARTDLGQRGLGAQWWPLLTVSHTPRVRTCAGDM